MKKRVIGSEHPKQFCEECGVEMIYREPKPHQHWLSFYGCKNFPSCKFTLSRDPMGNLIPSTEENPLAWIFKEEYAQEDKD